MPEKRRAYSPRDDGPYFVRGPDTGAETRSLRDLADEGVIRTGRIQELARLLWAQFWETDSALGPALEVIVEQSEFLQQIWDELLHRHDERERTGA